MAKGLKTLVYQPEKQEDKKINKVNELLPSPVVRWVIVGSTLSGKSNIIKNILFNKDWGYSKYFDEIYCWIGSTDDFYEYKRLAKEAKMKKIEFLEKYYEAAVEDLYNQIDESNGQTTDPSRVLFVFDDQIMNGISRINKMNTMDRLFVAGRHANISVVISTQKYSALNQNMRRLNTTAISVINGVNIHEVEAIANDHCASYNVEDFKRAILDNIKNRYEYITIDLKREFNERMRDKHFLPIAIKQNLN